MESIGQKPETGTKPTITIEVAVLERHVCDFDNNMHDLATLLDALEVASSKVRHTADAETRRHLDRVDEVIARMRITRVSLAETRDDLADLCPSDEDEETVQ